MRDLLWAETIKLAIQFVGALLIARLAVGWALRRYKLEKTWERRLSAYVDVLAALGEMRSIIGRWHDEMITDREVPEDQAEAQRVRYQAARWRLEEGVATATLLLPPSSSRLLAGLNREIENSRKGRDQVADLDAQYAVLDQTIKRLTADGRVALEMNFAAEHPIG